MSKLPLVSVGIPAYNRPNTLGDTLKSIINQSYQNIEIIISDNCSSDIEVSKIINKFIEKDSRIHYFKQLKNIGASANFKFVKEKASGEYFMWASDDDIWDKSYIEEGMKVLLTHKEYNAWFCTIENIDSFNRTIRKYKGFSRFSSTSNKWIDIIKYGLEPEILGKANLIYSIYEIESLEKIMNKYFINEKWGSEYCFNLAYLIDNNVFISNGAFINNEVISSKSLVIGRSPNLVVKKDLKKRFNYFFKDVNA